MDEEVIVLSENEWEVVDRIIQKHLEYDPVPPPEEDLERYTWFIVCEVRADPETTKVLRGSETFRMIVYDSREDEWATLLTEGLYTRVKGLVQEQLDAIYDIDGFLEGL